MFDTIAHSLTTTPRGHDPKAVDPEPRRFATPVAQPLCRESIMELEEAVKKMVLH